MYDCYAFTHDLQTLKETIYPTMEEAARLFSGLLTEDKATGRLVYGPGGYRFSDFIRIGLPMNLIILCANIFIVNLVYPLQQI